jgi:hypothetical protein
MPNTVAVTVAVIGSVLILVAIVGGNVKIFGAEVSGKISNTSRWLAGVLGVSFISLALMIDSPFLKTPSSLASPTSLAISPMAEAFTSETTSPLQATVPIAASTTVTSLTNDSPTNVAGETMATISPESTTVPTSLTVHNNTTLPYPSCLLIGDWEAKDTIKDAQLHFQWNDADKLVEGRITKLGDSANYGFP